MKIGMVSGEYPPMEGGVGAFTKELAQALHNAGHEIHVITSRHAWPLEQKRTLRNRNQPVDVAFAQLHLRIDRWRWPSLSTIVDIALRYDLQVINIQYQASAYNMHSAAINLLPWRLKAVTDTVVTFHDLRVPYLFPKAGRLRQAVVRLMAKQANGVIATNAGDYERLTMDVSTPIAQIPIGSNISAYTPNHIEIAEAREQMGLLETDYLIGYFGFLNESKGGDILLQALSSLEDNYHLVFIGGQTGTSDATNVDFLKRTKLLIKELGLIDRVHWTGFIPDTRVSAFLHAADLMVMPYRDGASLRRGTLMAALAHGRPLITTIPSEPTPELEHGKNIWLIPADDRQALAQAIAKLADDTELGRGLGLHAAQTANLFTWEQIAKTTAAFFAKISDVNS